MALITHEDIEGESSSLPSARLVVASESDDVAGILHIIIVLFEVRKDLSCPLIQGERTFFFRTFGFKRLAYSLSLGCTLDL